MCPRTGVRDLPHLHITHIITQRPPPLPLLHRPPHRRTHELGVYAHAADELEVGVQPGEECRLPTHLAPGREGELVGGIGELEDA
jgi:hypothetical protein